MATIISLIGEQNIPNLLPVLYLQPEQVVVVYTELTTKTAVRLTHLIKNKTKVLPLLVDAYDIAQTKEAILNMVQSFATDDISINFTGGTKTMSLAAYQAAVDLNAPIFYLQSQGTKTLLYFYEPENGRYPHHRAEEIPPLITISDYLNAHLEDYQITGIVNSSDRGRQFEQAVHDNLKTSVDEICAGVKRFNTIDIDFVVRCGNIVGIIETKTGLKGPKAGIDQLNTAGGREYLGTYTQKFFVCDQTWGKNLQDLKQIAEERHITIIELPSFGQSTQLSQGDILKLQTTISKKLGCSHIEKSQATDCTVLQLLPDDEIVECKPAPKKK